MSYKRILYLHRKNQYTTLICIKHSSYKQILNEFLEKNTPNRSVNEENLDDNDNESLDDTDNDTTSSQVQPHTTTQIEKPKPTSRNVINATNNVTNNNTVTPKKKANACLKPKDAFRDMCNDNLHRLKSKKIPKMCFKEGVMDLKDKFSSPNLK